MITADDLKFFAAVATAPSLAAVSRALDISPSAVTQRLHQLERRLRVRLVERSSRRMRLTEEGALLAERGRAVLSSMDEIVDELGRRSSRVTGCLRIAAPFGFGREYVAPVMAKLGARHPELELLLWLFDDPASALGGANWDILIHVGPLRESLLTMRRLAPNRRILCAAPSYLERHGQPDSPDELAQHRCGVIREDQADVSLLQFDGPHGQQQSVRLRPAFTSNDGQVVRAWAAAGLGVVVRSEWDVAGDLAAGQLVELLPDWQLPNADVVALVASRTARLSRTAAFLELITQSLRPAPWRQASAPPS
jgi:DNA-binding transcriptional LysR family regulator